MTALSNCRPAFVGPRWARAGFDISTVLLKIGLHVIGDQSRASFVAHFRRVGFIFSRKKASICS
jgi:hypothetical protein